MRIYEDLGYRDRTFCSPETYAALIFPDYAELRQKITARIKALIKKGDALSRFEHVAPTVTVEGLQGHEVAVLVSLACDAPTLKDSVSAEHLATSMGTAGYTDVATKIAAHMLAKRGLIEDVEEYDEWRQQEYTAYRLTAPGADWLVENQDGLPLRERETQDRAPELDADSNPRADE